MRTATTIGKRHGGKWELVSGPDISIDVQSKSFRSLKSSQTNPDYEEIQYQEKDQTACLLRFKKPETKPTQKKG